jgi:hypothetical protein
MGLARPSKAMPSATTEDMVIRAMFETVFRMRNAPWGNVKNLMAEHRLVIGRLDKRWMDD